MAKQSSHLTTDRKNIQRWVEKRGGVPACVKVTGSSRDPGMLRIMFSDEAAESLQQISWEEFFAAFEDNKLAFLYQEETKGDDTSRFFKLVDRRQHEDELE